MSENEEITSPSAPADENAPATDPSNPEETKVSPKQTKTGEQTLAESPKPKLSPFEKLVKKLNSKNFRERNDAIKKLGKSKNPKAKEVLMDIVKGDKWNRRLRVSALDAVSKGNRSKEFFNFLQGLAKDPKQHREIRRGAITQLTYFREPKLVPLFSEALNDEYRFIRFWAVRGLIKIGEIKGTTALIPALGDEDEEIRKEVMAHLESAGKEIVPALIKAFNNQDAKRFLRYGTLGIIGRLDHPDRIPTLLKAINDDDPRVVTIALRGLGKAKDNRSIQPLIDLFFVKENKRRLIEDALFRIGQDYQKEMVVTLAKLLVHEDPDAVQFAKNAMGKFGNAYVYLGDLANEKGIDPALKTAIQAFMKEL